MTFAGSDTLWDYQAVLQTTRTKIIPRTSTARCGRSSGFQRDLQQPRGHGDDHAPGTGRLAGRGGHYGDHEQGQRLDIPILADNADPDPGDTIQVTQVEGHA